jgi:UPF0176 protein
MEAIRNIAFYKFIDLENPELLRGVLLKECEALRLKGTILLAHEGINAMLAGADREVQVFENFITNDLRFNDVLIKRSFSKRIPFKKLMIKVKPEVLTLGLPEIRPQSGKANYIKPEEFNHALNNHEDITLVDVRNDFEVQWGTCEGALNPRTKSFSEFSHFGKNLAVDKEKKIVTFCTGGIRCEKGALILKEYGFKNVYQLEGGILEYFSKIPNSSHFKGECFVFDEREALDTSLKSKK